MLPSISSKVAEAPADTRHNPIRLMVLGGDTALDHAIEGCCCTLSMAVRIVRDPLEAAEAMALGEADVAVIDADWGAERIISFVRRVRSELCVDWAPLMLAGDAPGLRATLHEAVPGMVDHIIAKPLEHYELHQCLVAARRTVALKRAFDSTLDRVSEAVIVIDGQARVHSFNAAAQRLFQWQDSEMRGASLNRLMPSSQRHGHDGYMARYQSTGQATVIGQGRVESGLRRDGSQFPMHLTVNDISDSYGVRFVGVIRDLTADQEAEALRERSWHDALTGLPNLSRAQEQLHLACVQAGEGDAGFALIYLDLDRFKPVNDVHGHAVGNEVLKAVARRLRHSLGEHDLVARLGGDEFLVLLRGVTQPAQAQAVIRRLVTSVARPIVIGPSEILVGISAGGAVYGQDGTHPQELLHAADQAMYSHKRGLASQRLGAEADRAPR